MLTHLFWLPFTVLLAPASRDSAAVRVQQPKPPTTTAASLVFDGVTVIDVEGGRRLQAQRVVVVGNRIQAVGGAGTVSIPAGARVVDARGKYLIPGLWDMHTHSRRYTDVFYPLFITSGVTGIRDAASNVPLDTLIQWRREIVAGARVGPPRQLFAGPAIEQMQPCIRKTYDAPSPDDVTSGMGHLCVADAADARHVVDSLKAAGADFIKTYDLDQNTYFAIAAEARRVGIPFGGHFDGTESFLLGKRGYGPATKAILTRFSGVTTMLWAGSRPHNNWLHDSASTAPPADSNGFFRIARQAGLPIIAGTDVAEDVIIAVPPDLGLHAELAIEVAEGLTPLEALQTATLNPAKYLHGTDSLGTVAPGKLADLVLLDADPLADITNTTTIRAVVANGRYFDSAALDQLVATTAVHAKPALETLEKIRKTAVGGDTKSQDTK